MKAKYSPVTHDAEVEVDLQEVSGFLGKIAPKSIKETGGIIYDQVRFWRFKNQVKILKKAEALIGDNTEIHNINLKVLVPLLESGSLEEENSLQDKWAAMLANAAAQTHSVLPLFPALLSELSGVEVMILDNLYMAYVNSVSQPVQFDKHKIRTTFSLNEADMDVIVENLFRLNICSSPGSVGAMIGQYPFSVHTNEIFELTALGIAFIQACQFMPNSTSK